MTPIKKTINFSLPTSYLLGVFFIFLFMFINSISSVQAAATSTIRGAAWWGESTGFVYFNCLDSVSGDRLNRDGNLTPPGFRFHIPPCFYEYNVFIDAAGNLGGKAWNYNKGFISFAGTTTPPDGYGSTNASGRCLNTCNAGNNCWGCYNEEQKRLYGWARVDASGEWIRLDSSLAGQPPVQIETCALEPLLNAGVELPTAAMVSPGDFFGVAVSTSSENLFFNCKNEANVNACINRGNYKVYISTLTIGALTAPNFTYAQACGGSGLGATLGWCVKSGQQTAYEIVVNKGFDFGPNPTPEQISAATCRSGKKPSNFSTQYVLPNHDFTCSSLEYGSHYYWWIRLYNENNEPTRWYQYFGNSGSDTDRDIDTNPKTFSTFKHKFPSPFFDWPEGDIVVGSSTEFTSDANENYSVYYTSSSPTTPQRCTSLACTYFWWSSDLKAVFSSTSAATTSINFETIGDTTVSLMIIDPSGYQCSKTSPIKNLNYDLPVWREVKAR